MELNALQHRYDTGAKVRAAIRSGEWTGRTYGMAPGFIQANLAIVPKEFAFEFLAFCRLNPKPCPLLEVTEPGSPKPRHVAADADIRTDLSGYFVYREGKLAERRSDIVDIWRDDHVAFLLGCSLSFDEAMINSGIPLRHLSTGEGQVSNYITNVECTPFGRLAGPMVVSMRPTPLKHLARVIELSQKFWFAHGTPIHVGTPKDIGIQDLEAVDWGDKQDILEGEVPAFWACGITPQAVALRSKIPEMITHVSGHMFMTDLKPEEMDAEPVAQSLKAATVVNDAA